MFFQGGSSCELWFWHSGYYVSKDDFSTQPYPPTDIIHTFKAFSFVPILLKMLPISDLLTSGETSLGELLGTCGDAARLTSHKQYLRVTKLQVHFLKEWVLYEAKSLKCMNNISWGGTTVGLRNHLLIHSIQLCQNHNFTWRTSFEKTYCEGSITMFSNKQMK